jgi:hypothetical protein
MHAKPSHIPEPAVASKHYKGNRYKGKLHNVAQNAPHAHSMLSTVRFHILRKANNQLSNCICNQTGSVLIV